MAARRCCLCCSSIPLRPEETRLSCGVPLLGHYMPQPVSTTTRRHVLDYSFLTPFERCVPHKPTSYHGHRSTTPVRSVIRPRGGPRRSNTQPVLLTVTAPVSVAAA